MERNIVIRNKEIEEALREQGYSDESIDYKELQELYKPYQKEMSEEHFAKILGVSSENYRTAKYNGTRVRILKTKEVAKERKEEIREALRDQGYSNKSIDYQELQELYKPYQKEMSEEHFAKTLGVSYPRYNDVRHNGIRIMILKTKEVAKERKEEIREALRDQGYSNKSIDYQELQELYKPYQKEMSEEHFARILGVYHQNYKTAKNDGKRVIILKTKEVTEERKEEIRKALRDQGYSNKKIDYQELQELYKSYQKEMREVDFVEILEVSYARYVMAKTKGTKVRVLKAEKVKEVKGVTEERKEEIREALRAQGYSNKPIDCKELQELYKSYQREMKEKDFVRILEVSYENYKTAKNKGTRVIILKTKEVTEERKEEIREALRAQGYSDKSIDYQELQELYKPYQKEMKEVDFAEILEVSYPSYAGAKTRGRRVKILKTKEITEERKEEIREELRAQGYSNKSIDYQELQELYKPYQKEMREVDFAEILEMSYSSYGLAKTKGWRVKILKTKELAEERKEEIREALKAQGYSDKLIDYKKLQELYKPYSKEMRERDFAEILGLTYANYRNAKDKGKRVRIKFKSYELNIVRYKLHQCNREYKKEELENICRECKITLRDLLIDIYGKNDYVENLIKRDSIYIGKCEIPKEFSNKHARELLDLSKKISKMKTSKYNLLSLSNDFASDALMYVLKNRGDVVINSENEESALLMLRMSINIFIKYSCMNNLSVRKNRISLDESIESGKRYGSSNLHSRIKDSKTDIEKEVEQKMEDNDDYTIQTREEKTAEEQSIVTSEVVKRMRKCYDEGMNNVQAIKTITEEYGISKESLLKILEEELTKKRKSGKTAIDSTYSGEELE